MIRLAIIAAAIFSVMAIVPALAEVEVRDSVGRVIEYRVRTGNVTKVYDGKRRLIYIATRQGNQIIFRDPSGVIIGKGGPATISDPRGVLARIRDQPTHDEDL